MKYIPALACLAACSSMQVTGPSTEIRPDFIQDAYDTVIQCAAIHGYTPKRMLNEIVFHNVPTRWVTVNGKEYGGYTIGHNIYIGQERINHQWTYEHELMHSVFKLGSEHPNVFRACNLLME